MAQSEVHTNFLFGFRFTHLVFQQAHPPDMRCDATNTLAHRIFSHFVRVLFVFNRHVMTIPEGYQTN